MSTLASPQSAPVARRSMPARPWSGSMPKPASSTSGCEPRPTRRRSSRGSATPISRRAARSRQAGSVPTRLKRRHTGGAGARSAPTSTASPTSRRNSDVPPIEFARAPAKLLLTNPGPRRPAPGHQHDPRAAAVSIYNPGDVAPVHVHTPNASRTIQCPTTAATPWSRGERCVASERGDPHPRRRTAPGTTDGNDGATPVVWIDVLDFPLMEFLDCVWLDDEFHGERAGNTRAQAARLADGYSQKLYGTGGMVPDLRVAPARHRPPHHPDDPLPRRRDPQGAGRPRQGKRADPYEGASRSPSSIRSSGEPVVPDARLCGASCCGRARKTRLKRETASTMYVVIEGAAARPEIAGQALRVGEERHFRGAETSRGGATSTPAPPTRCSIRCRTRR